MRERERDSRYERDVEGSEVRKQRARREGDSFVSWLGTFGLVGWSIAVPTIIAIAIGVWLDQHYQTSFSWTLTLLFVGVCLGCALAWYWVRRESAP